MRRRGKAAVLVAFAVCACTGAWSSSASPARVESKHFVIAYDSRVSFAYVQLVERGLEAAYDAFVVHSSFWTFAPPVEVRIPNDGMDGMGAEYLETDA
ncbi:MAG: hypothetical protein NTV92_04655, partial [Candidatus Bipolaricaulota bacterium]|nr:hypothetical protein [Candidatus Bipolaricaulota bacterium]